MNFYLQKYVKFKKIKFEMIKNFKFSFLHLISISPQIHQYFANVSLSKTFYCFYYVKRYIALNRKFKNTFKRIQLKYKLNRSDEIFTTNYDVLRNYAALKYDMHIYCKNKNKSLRFLRVI